VVPAHEIADVISNMGLTVSPINLSMSDGSLISSADGEILIALRPDHAPTAGYERALRRALWREHPDKTFYFAAPDLATQVLNFGISAPIDVQDVGAKNNLPENVRIAEELREKIAKIPGAVDVHLHQPADVPELASTSTAPRRRSWG